YRRVNMPLAQRFGARVVTGEGPFADRTIMREQDHYTRLGLLPRAIAGNPPSFDGLRGAIGALEKAMIKSAVALELSTGDFAKGMARARAVIRAVEARLQGKAMMQIADDDDLAGMYATGKARSRVASTELSADAQAAIAADTAMTQRLTAAKARALGYTNQEAAALAQAVAAEPKLVQSILHRRKAELDKANAAEVAALADREMVNALGQQKYLRAQREAQVLSTEQGRAALLLQEENRLTRKRIRETQS